MRSSIPLPIGRGAECEPDRARMCSNDTSQYEAPRNVSEKQLRTDANKALAFWAARRTDLRLLRQQRKATPHSEHLPDRSRREENLLGELQYILEYLKPTYPPYLESLGLSEKMGLKERKLALEIPIYTPDYSLPEQNFMAYMENIAKEGRQAEWKWRIANHAEEYQAKGWYPFFVTLTIDPSQHDAETVWKSGRPLRRYIRRLCNVVTGCLGHPKAHKSNTPESEYITYVGVVEHGKSRHHHHGHFLIWMREIPEDWKKCPNKFISNPQARNRRECVQLRSYWGDYNEEGEWIPYSLPGLSPAIYFRSVGDVWSRMGHCVPLKNGKAIRLGTAAQSGAYICKYLGKDHKEWQHRVKATRNLGKKNLINLIRAMPDHLVEAATWRAPTYTQSLGQKMIHNCPPVLLRRLAKQEDFYRKYHARQLDLKSLTSQKSGVFLRMLQSVRDGRRPDRMPLEDFYDWVSRLLPDQNEFCEDRFWELHKLLAKHYPVPTRYNHTSLEGNDIGHS